MRGLRGTLVLLVIVAALAGALFVIQSDPPTSPHVTEPVLENRPLLSAVRISVRNQPGVQPIQLERNGFAFDVTEPVRDLASRQVLETIAAAWDTAVLRRVYSPEDLTPDLLAQTGLDAPRAELEVVFDDRVVAVELGEEGVLGEDIYVRKNGDVFLTSKALLTVLGGTPDDFREGLVFRTPPRDVKRLTVTYAGAEGERRLVVRKLREGDYRLEQPIATRASTPDVLSLLGGLLGMRVGMFVSGNMSIPPRPPDFACEIQSDGPTERLQMWRMSGGGLMGFQLERELVFRLEGRDYERLFDGPEERLRSRLLIRSSPNDFLELRIDPGAGERATVLRRGAGQLLELVQPVSIATHPTAISVLLQGLTQFAAQDFIDAGGDYAPYGLDEGYLTLEVRAQMNPLPDVVHVGKIEGDVCYVKRADEPHVAVVPAACGEAFRTPWPEFVDRTVHRIVAVDNVRRLRYRRGTAERVYVVDNAGAWRLDGQDAVRDDVAETVEELADLKAEKVLDPATVAPGEQIEIELQTQNGMVLRRLLCTREGDRALIRRPEVEVVYQLRPRLSAAILALAP